MERSDIEDLFLQVLLELDDEDKKRIDSENEAYAYFNYDVEEEIKEELYRIAMSVINWREIIRKMKEDLPESEEEEKQ
jgi:hypothetical protein